MDTPHQQPNRTYYVLGFAFDTSGAEPSVCLMTKMKPDWQAGHLNGVGGKIKPDESPVAAMAREFLEETGVETDVTSWVRFFVMRFWNGAVVHCFAAHMPDDQHPRTMEEEPVAMFELDRKGRWNSTRAAIPNLNWLIPMAWHQLTEPNDEQMVVFDPQPATEPIAN